jgi:hypothetical protein
MSQKYTAEEVRAIARRLHDDITVRDGDTLTASDMLTAYADSIERAQAGVTNEVVERACDANYNDGFCPPVFDAVRAALLAVWPAITNLPEIGNKSVDAVTCKPCDGMGNIMDMRCIGCDGTGRVARPSGPVAQGEAVALMSVTDDVTPVLQPLEGWRNLPNCNYLLYAAHPAMPAGVPDATKVHVCLPPGYRMATRDGDYWPLFGDAYCTNYAFPTRELAALEAWKQAHKKLNDSMDSIRRFVAVSSAFEGEP